ncbi:hypothetical protein K501DRAFT_284781 [Backusella circina FSU 941]|nr:hypothetical protein K501DRAFT_284781 [Backusella circina FSU 941]
MSLVKQLFLFVFPVFLLVCSVESLRCSGTRNDNSNTIMCCSLMDVDGTMQNGQCNLSPYCPPNASQTFFSCCSGGISSGGRRSMMGSMMASSLNFKTGF